MTFAPDSFQRFFLKQLLHGFCLSVALTIVLIWADIAQLGTLIATMPMGWLAGSLLFLLNGLTFASVQIGIAVMQASGDEDSSGTPSLWHPGLARVRVEHSAQTFGEDDDAEPRRL